MRDLNVIVAAVGDAHRWAFSPANATSSTKK